MEEVMEVSTPVESTPEPAAAEPVAEAESAVETQTEEQPKEEEGAVTPPAAEPAEPEGEKPEEAPPAPVPVTVSIDGEERSFSPEEAAPLIEGGMRWNEFAECYAKLEYLAQSIHKDVPEMIEAMVASSEKNEIAKLQEQCGGNEEIAKQLYAYQKKDRMSALEEKKAAALRSKEEMSKAQREQLEDTLAQGFIELAREVPDAFPSFKDVPKPIVEMAIDKKISLLDAYLRFEHGEAKKRDSAKAKKAYAASSSAGTMESQPVNVSPEIDAFMQGLHRSL